jgi:hypothetical protein
MSFYVKVEFIKRKNASVTSDTCFIVVAVGLQCIPLSRSVSNTGEESLYHGGEFNERFDQ